MFSKFFKRVSDNIPQLPPHHVLVDFSTNIVLTASPRLFDVVFLMECLDAREIMNANQPNYQKFFFLLTLDPAQFPEWTWQDSSRTFVKTPFALLTPKIRALSSLATLKKDLVREIVVNINMVRNMLRSDVSLQETVYLAKRMQAEAFKFSGYDEAKILEYPFVLQYAELAGLSYRTAADEILFKSRLADEVLAKSERLRLKYFDAVKKADTPKELEVMRRQFLTEFFVNTII